MILIPGLVLGVVIVLLLEFKLRWSWVTGETWGSFRDRHGDRRRDLVLWVARRCTGMTAAELGRAAGGMDHAAVTMAVRRFPSAQTRDKNLARLTAQVVTECQ